ncbi:MAG: hypothetical protein KGN84_08655 [Acidobacteriota bacterium]|nr:hypothetical protein [Acidobacteriota bacterium]
MAQQDRVVSLHPYFRISEGKMAEAVRLCDRFVAATATEAKCLYYSFSFNGAEMFCREAYEDAEGLLAHLTNVESLLKELLNLAELIRLEVHAPADELAKLEQPLSDLKPTCFTVQPGIRR